MYVFNVCIHFEEFGHTHTPVITITTNKVINISIISKAFLRSFALLVLFVLRNEMYPINKFSSAQQCIVN